MLRSTAVHHRDLSRSDIWCDLTMYGMNMNRIAYLGRVRRQPQQNHCCRSHPHPRPRNTSNMNAINRNITKYANIRQRSRDKLEALSWSDDNIWSPRVYKHRSPVAHPIAYPLNTARHISSNASWNSDIWTNHLSADGIVAMERIRPPHMRNGNKINGVISGVDRTPPIHEMM